MRQQSSALVVEDSPYMRTMLRELLHSMSVSEVEAVASIADAQTHLNYLVYDVAIIDVGLADENGLDLIRAIRGDKSHPARQMPFVVVSGQTERSVVSAARDAGANAFVAKPVSAGVLSDKVRRAMDGSTRFVECESYFGPDRRRKADPDYCGPERRRAPSDDLYV